MTEKQKKIEELQLSVLKSSLQNTLFSAHLNGRENKEKSFFEWEKSNNVVDNLTELVFEILNLPKRP